jgi:hypothetical protein
MNKTFLLRQLILVLALCAGCLHSSKAPAQSPTSTRQAISAAAPKSSYTPASVHAAPGLTCDLSDKAGGSSAKIRVYSDDDGYVRFHAVHPPKATKATQLSLDCTDAEGNSHSYPVNLNDSAVFLPHPLNIAHEAGIDRPALAGDPLGYSQLQLLQSGYGLRPDPSKDTAAYARWLASAHVSGRILRAVRPSLRTHGVSTITAGAWAGSILTGAPNYVSTEAIFNVPTAIPGGDGTSTTEVAIWNGLGGFNQSAGLIQGMIFVQTTPTAASYASGREYCCGYARSNGYGGAFTPNPGDQIYSQQWYCDAQGQVNINGGYGCSLMVDMSSGAVLTCTQAQGSPCWSAPAGPGCTTTPNNNNCNLGLSAEFIIENQISAYTDFQPRVTIAGSAYSSATGTSQTISSDPSVVLVADSTNTTTHLSVTLGTSDQTYFDVNPKPFELFHDWQVTAGANWAGAVPLGGYARQLVPARNQDGRLEVFYVGTDSRIYHNYQSSAGGAWAGEAALGGLALQLAVVQNTDGRLEVFYVGTDHLIYHNWQTSPNSGWAGEHALGGSAQQVTAARNADGRLELFYIGTNSGLYHNWQTAVNGAWAGEAAFSGDSAKQITVVANADQRLELFYVGTNDDLYHNWQVAPNGSWAGETHFSGDSAKQVTAGLDTEGRVEIFYVGTNDDLYHNWQTSPGGNWFGETRFAHNSARQVTVAGNADGRLEIFYIGTDGNIYHNWQNSPSGSWFGETRLDTRATEVAAELNKDGRLELFYINN